MTDLKQAAQQALECIKRLNKHGWILADHEDEVYSAIIALKAALKQQPVQEQQQARVDVITVNLMREGINKHRARELADHFVNFTSPPPLPVQRKPLTDDVLVPMEILEAAASSLDSFCGNLGWGDADLQNMDNLFALISQHKAAYNIKEKTND
jgi:hypothetical protein